MDRGYYNKCVYCKEDKKEDVVHLLFNCKVWSKERRNILKIDDDLNLTRSDNNKVKGLLSSSLGLTGQLPAGSI